MGGRQFRRVLDAHDPLTRIHGAEQRREQGGLARTRAPDDEEGEPGGDDPAQQHVGVRVDGAAIAQRVESLGGGPQHPQRQTRATLCDGREDGMQADTEIAVPGQPAIDPRLGVVEPPPGEQREALGQSPHRRLVGKGDGGEPQPAAAVDPDAVGGR